MLAIYLNIISNHFLCSFMLLQCSVSECITELNWIGNNFRNSYLNGSEIALEIWFTCTLLITMKLLKTKQNIPICTWLMTSIRLSTDFSQWPYPVSELLPQKWLEESEDHVEYVRLIDYVNILYSQCDGILQRNTKQHNIKTFG
jgi:hypothetical protein